MKNIPGILLSIDFEKAFDSISWDFIFKCMESFNFGQKFISYIKTLYKNISTAVINNGHILNWFFPKRGVRQGCPISSYLFILAVEVLACNIRQDKDIKGIKVEDQEIKISELADDTICCISDEPSLLKLLGTFKSFKLVSGLGINVDKTSAKCLGPYVPSNKELGGINWSKDPIFTLGVTISGNEDDHYILNFKKRLKNLQNLLNSWKCRYLSLKGKITVINTLALPPLIYLASVIYVPPIVITEVKKVLLDFIWNGGTPKIAYNTLIQDIEDGGLKLVDFESKVKSLKLGWIKRLCDESNGKWKAAPSAMYKTSDLKFYFKCNYSCRKDIPCKFYTDVHNYFSEINTLQCPNEEIIKNQVIWNNRYITIQNKPFVWENWLQHGILRVKDLIDEEGHFIDATVILHRYGIRCNFLSVLQIRQSLPLHWRRVLASQKKCAIYDNEIVLFFFGNSCSPSEKCDTRKIYRYFTKNKLSIPTCVTRWTDHYPQIDQDWADVFRRPFRISQATKLQSFQYRVIHRIITCNKSYMI